METKAAAFTFEVPENHPDAGKSVTKTFEYTVCENDQEAAKEMTRRKWSLTKIVNARIKATERQASYQNALIPYRRDVSPDDVRRAVVRNLIAAGFSEEMANQQTDAVLSLQKNQENAE